MKNPDDQDVAPEDIFEQIEPDKPESLGARIREGDVVEPDELTYDHSADTDADEAWEADEDYLEHLEDIFHQRKPEDPKPAPEAEPEKDKGS